MTVEPLCSHPAGRPLQRPVSRHQRDVARSGMPVEPPRNHQIGISLGSGEDHRHSSEARGVRPIDPGVAGVKNDRDPGNFGRRQLPGDQPQQFLPLSTQFIGTIVGAGQTGGMQQVVAVDQQKAGPHQTHPPAFWRTGEQPRRRAASSSAKSSRSSGISVNARRLGSNLRVDSRPTNSGIMSCSQ